MKKLFRKAFYAIRIDDSRVSLFGKGVQIVDIDIEEIDGIISHSDYPTARFKLPYWFIVLFTVDKVLETYNYTVEKRFYGNLTRRKNRDKEIDSISTIIDDYKFIHKEYPELVLKYIGLDLSVHPTFDKEGNYNEVI